MTATADPRAFGGSDDVYQRIQSIESNMPTERQLPIRDKALAAIRFLEQQSAWVDDSWQELPVDAQQRLVSIAYELLDLHDQAPSRALGARLQHFWWKVRYLREWSHDPTVPEVSYRLISAAGKFADTILSHVERGHPDYEKNLAAAIATGRDDSKIVTTVTKDNVDEYLAQLMDD